MEKRRYFIWLCNQINNEDNDTKRYSELLWTLFNREFIYFFKNDCNRARDGEYLRYIYDANADLEKLGPCRVLEMLVALSQKGSEMILSEYNVNQSTFFWMMLGNLQLDLFDNENFDRTEVTRILDRFMRRLYTRNGIGSLFPLINNIDFFNQKKDEIWYQMMNFLTINF